MSSLVMAEATAAQSEVEFRLLAARSELERRLATGSLQSVEELSSLYPDLWDNPDTLVELVFAEFVHRSERGEDPRREDWLQHYPSLQDRLKRLFAVYDAVVTGDSVPDDNAVTYSPLRQREQSPLKFPIRELPGYELIEEIGRGGTGIVYKAKQVDLNRIVAIKILRSGRWFSDQEAVRFAREAEAAARLQHPHIVQIHEIGDSGGVPFLCLEFVSGGSLEDHLKHEQTGTPPVVAARFVETLARAMHVAHLHGVVHRDLKPGNILLRVDSEHPAASDVPVSRALPRLSEATPKISDFGLARLVEEAPSETRTGMIVGTPSYMAPEQAEGKGIRVGPRTDIHALGAVLYRILTGRPPFDGGTPTDTMEMVRHSDPVPPRRLRPSIPRDLETICLRCLQKDAAKRYATAQDLAEDLRRFLAKEPIRARPISLVERCVKWVNRRPAIAGLTFLALIIVVGSTGGFLWHHLSIREEERATLETLLASLQTMEEICTPVWENEQPRDSRTEKEERRLLERAQGLYEAFSEKHGNNPVVRWHMAKAQGALGRIHSWMARPVEAQRAYLQAVAFFRQLNEEHPDGTYLRELASHCHRLGASLFSTGDHPRARGALLEAERISLQLSNQQPGNPELGHELANVRRTLAECYWAEGAVEEAERTFRQAADQANELAQKHPQAGEYRHTQANALQGLGELQMLLDKPTLARKFLSQALTLNQVLCQEAPTNAIFRRSLAGRHNSLGVLYSRTGKIQQAEESYQQALGISREMAREYPNVPSNQLFVARYLNNLASLGTRGKEAKSREAYDLCRNLVAEHPEVIEYQFQLGSILGNLGKGAFNDGNHPESRRLLDEALSYQRTVLERSPKRRMNLIVLRDTICTSVETDLARKDRGRAFRTALEIPNLLPADWDSYSRAAYFLTRCRLLVFSDLQLTRKEALLVARSYTERAIELLGKAISLKPSRPDLYAERALHHASLEQWAQAAEDFGKAVALKPSNPDMQFNYAATLLLSGEAEAYREVCRRVRECIPEKDPRLCYLLARIEVLDPNSLPDSPKRSLRLAADAVRADSNLGWHLNGMGMAHYRAGEFEQAQRLLNQADLAFWNEDGRVGNWVALALAHYRLGHFDESRRWLERFDAWLGKVAPGEPPGVTPGILPMHPHNWFACLLLRREAEIILRHSNGP